MGFYPTREFSLTEKGKEVTEIAVELKKIIEKVNFLNLITSIYSSKLI